MKVTRSKRVLFSVAVAFVSVFFFAYAILAVYPAPQWDDFCDRDAYREKLDSEADCSEAGGRWTGYDDGEGWCDVNYYCQAEYDAVRKPYERSLFFANLGIGIVVFLFALFLGLEVVSSGLMGGGIMLMVYGSLRYWGELSDIWRTLMLGVALVALIYVGYKKLAD